jgi:hypothetical protein
LTNEIAEEASRCQGLFPSPHFQKRPWERGWIIYASYGFSQKKTKDDYRLLICLMPVY